MLTQDDIIYFVLTDRFADGDPDNNFDVNRENPQAYHGGDFAGIVERIPYLQHLGVTALWITPVFENNHRVQDNQYGYHGYWPLDFEKVDPHLYSAKPGIPAGSKRYLKDLVDQLHAAGIKVILDMVVNHTGYDHPGRYGDPSTPIKPHWFTPDRTYEEMGPIGSWLSGLPDLDQNNAEVADYFVNMVADWIEETGVDCIRMDTAQHVEDTFWHYYSTVIKGKFPTISLLGEVMTQDIDHNAHYQRSFNFDSLFDFPLQDALKKVFIEGAPFTIITSPYSAPQRPGQGVLDRDIVYSNHNNLVTLLDNHDLASRFFTAALDKSNGDRRWAIDHTKLALTMLFTTRGIPQLYYGTELGMEGGHDPDNRRDMRWDLVENGLEPSDKHPEAHEFYHHTHQLIQLRRSSQALRYGSQITLHVSEKQYVFLREYRSEWMLVAINLADDDMLEPIVIDLADHSVIPPRLQAQINAQQYVDIHRFVQSGRPVDNKISLQLPAHSSAVLMPLHQMLVSVK